MPQETSDREISADLPGKERQVKKGNRSRKKGKSKIFYREKAFHAMEKIRKNDFASSEKYPSYAPALAYNHIPYYNDLNGQRINDQLLFSSAFILHMVSKREIQ